MCQFKLKDSNSIYIDDDNIKTNNKGIDFIFLKRDRTKEFGGKKYIKVWAFDATVVTKN